MSQPPRARRGRPAPSIPSTRSCRPPKLAVYGTQHVLAFYAGAVIVPILLASAIGLTREGPRLPDQRRPVHLRHRLDHPGRRLLEGRRAAAAAAGRDVHRRGADDLDRQRQGRRRRRPAGHLRRGDRGRHRHVPDRAVLLPLLRLFPPVVTGTVITVIGIALLPVAAQERGRRQPAPTADFGSVPEPRAGRRHAAVHHRRSTGSSAGVPRHRRGAPRPRVRHRRRRRSSASPTSPASRTRTRSASPRRSTSARRPSCSRRSSR